MQNSILRLIKCCQATTESSSYGEQEGDKVLQNNAFFYVTIQLLNKKFYLKYCMIKYNFFSVNKKYARFSYVKTSVNIVQA